MIPDDLTKILPKLFKGLLGATLAVLVVWAIATFFSAKEANQVLPGTEQARRLARLETRKEIDKAAEKVHELAWLDKEKGTIHLPIERAMEVVATELAAKEVKASAVTVAWVAPEMPDYTKAQQPADAAAAPAAAPATGGTPAPAPAPAPAAPAAPAH